MGVYIPADIHWERQLTYTDEQLHRFPDLQRAVSQASVTTNILSATCSCMIERLELQYSRDEKKEEELSKVLIQEWKLPSTIPSLELVLQALDSRMNKIRAVANEAVARDSEPAKLDGFFYLDYLSAITVACGAFDRLFASTKKQRWALCFDELEIAPQWFQLQVFKQLRSTDQRFIFKLSTSPIPPSIGSILAQPRNDFTLVPLWHHSRRKTVSFSERLTASILKRKFGRSLKPAAVFGFSPLKGEGSRPERVIDYAKGSRTWQVIRELASWDSSLSSLLDKHGINPDDPSTSDPHLRDQVLRKLKPIVFHRHAFSKASRKGGRSLRSRKLSPYYHGIDAIYAISDGNPRWLTGIVTDILTATRNIKSVRIPARVQLDVIMKASEQFHSLIGILPQPISRTDEPSLIKPTASADDLTLIKLLEIIKEHFFRRQVLDDITLDPVGSFVVEKNISPRLAELLRLGSDNGAIVYVDPQNHPFDSGFSGKRFRLSYMLSPVWKLPLRCYKEVPLSMCFTKETDKTQQELPLEGTR